ncbi:hypothetical protein [Haloactinomyces albus]|uniref:Uncharacterized protein n=1 Tax=Haloactinomyces albus TaxID=1352928 RepID=A0AAE3ZJ94_9ACTN|nr:hypothetical protein [Haloactinomyces albus]MDR7301630.1 hypothetical protein [Haloactinomyces albus]MDR7304668.1 hypothetical protein [Haloactinomyces albus]MDR7304678.1 hypothetical protein [Haloactinomyces albus]MDR7304688.1 hypothetical protein [Haloactinomyces albus]MDR7304700.1 hypothetical protein [Haloactinomyces albus]
MMPQSRKATGHVDGRPVEFIPTHRDGNTSPATMRVSMTVPVSLEDVTAALWILVDGGMAIEELEDDEFAHMMVVETLFAEGGTAIAAALAVMDDLPPGSERAETAAMLRARVDKLYGQPLASTRYELAGGVRS